LPRESMISRPWTLTIFVDMSLLWSESLFVRRTS
jgi:hypothetical protein